MSNQPPITSDQANELLGRAAGIGGAVRSGVSWPFVLMLLGMGASGSLALPSFWLARHSSQPSPLLVWPMLLSLAWLGAFIIFGLLGARSSKRGFARFWGIAVGGWSLLWVAAMWLPPQLGDPASFSIAMSAVLLAWTVACSAWELKR